MNIELRIETDAFRKRLRARAKTLAIERTTPLTLPDSTTPLPLPGCGGAEIWLDRVDVWEGTILDTNDDGSLSVQQPIDLFVVSRPALEQNGAAPSPPCWGGTIIAVFRLASEEVDGEPRLCMSFERFDPGTNVPSEITTFLSVALAEEAAGLAGACEAIDVGVLGALFDGEPPPVTSLALALSSDSARLGLRIDFDVSALGLTPATAAALAAKQAVQQTNFAQATFLGDDASLPWTLIMHASLLTAGIRRQLSAGVEAEEKLDLVAGPSATFLIDSQHRPRIETSVEVQVIDACLCFSAETDLNVEVTSKVYLRLPEPDVMETRMEVEFDLDDLEVFCCSLTASVLWPIVGDALLLKNEEFGEEYAGGLVAHVFAPFVLAIAIMALAHSTAEDMITAPDDDWETVDEDDDRIVFRRRWNVGLGDFGFGDMTTTGITGVNHTVSGAKGIVLSGTLGPVFEAPDAKLDIEPDPEFLIGFDDPCGDAKAVAEWSLWLGSKASNGSSQTPVPLQVFDVRIVEETDPLNQYAPYLDRNGRAVGFRVPFAKIKKGYKDAPYRPQLLIITSGGVRIIRIPELPILSAAEVAQLESIKEMGQVLHCNDWALVDVFWSGSRYNPLWTVDPPPDSVIHQYWEVVVEGLNPSESVAIDDLAGQRLAVIRSTAKGGLAGYAVLSASGAGPVGLSLFKAGGPAADAPVIVAKSAAPTRPPLIARENFAAEALRLRNLIAKAGKTAKRRTRQAKRRLIVRQVALEPTSVIRVHARLRDVALADDAGRIELAVADSRGVACYAIARGTATLLRRVARRGVDRVLRWDGAWYTVGDGGLRPLDTVRASLERCCHGPERAVIDADIDGDVLFALDGDGLWSRRAGFESIERIETVQGTRIAIHNRTLAVVQPNAVQVFARPARGRARLIGTVKHRGATAIRAARGPGDSYRVNLVDGAAAIVSATADAVSVTARLPAARRTEIGARVANVVALIGPDAHEVLVCQIGGQATLHR